MILALDCATKTGFALVKDGKIIESGTMDFSKRRGESNGAMFLRFSAWIRNLWFNGSSHDESEIREKLAWAAGFFDGEGTTGCRKAYSKEYTRLDGSVANYESSNIAIQISQVDRSNLERFYDAIGGLGSIEGPYKDKRENASPIHMWRASGTNTVQSIIESMWPWLGEAKRKQAENALGAKITSLKKVTVLKNRPKGLIVYEMAHHRGGPATEICVNLTGRVQEFAATYSLEHVGIHTRTLKKWATGRGNVDKETMIAASVKYLGRQPEDDNEADAVLLAMYAHEEYGS